MKQPQPGEGTGLRLLELNESLYFQSVLVLDGP
ncbi:hypothetical protein SAMN05444955_11223 [Lihuaxuella thermophila]|uniref:Uncharacterized protein n=1 Tax=Lihuaxuella thermophila TaxID=1173111 RepID=A0A1H8GQN6_9BACL|nr:hypothetical protein SAMN05444955_11223 [Lihuaxuella thermophila]